MKVNPFINIFHQKSVHYLMHSYLCIVTLEIITINLPGQAVQITQLKIFVSLNFSFVIASFHLTLFAENILSYKSNPMK